MPRIDVTAHSDASPEQVWALLADVSTWTEWSSFEEATLEDPAITGVGAIRHFRVGRNRTTEEVVAFEPSRRFEYKLIRGLPIRDYHAKVTLVPDGTGGGTTIRWQSSYQRALIVPLALVRKKLETFVKDTAEALATAAGDSGRAEG